MTTIATSLEKAASAEERAVILNREFQLRKDDFNKIRGVFVSNAGGYKGLKVGDRVRYSNMFGERYVGYLSHFYLKMKDTHGSELDEKCRSLLEQGGDISYEEEGISVIPVIVPMGSSGYLTHNGPTLPERLDD